MQLNLKRPLAFFDLETTGTNIGSDRIVELAVIKIMTDGTERRIPAESGKRFLINPGKDEKGNQILIAPEATAVHGISDADVAEAPLFAEVAEKLYKDLFDCDLAGFNSNRFDVPMLSEEFARVGIQFPSRETKLLDVQVIFHMMEQRNLKAGYRFYCDKDLDDAHEAMADTNATFEIFLAMLEKYEGKEVEDREGRMVKPMVNDVDKLSEYFRYNNNADLVGRLIFNKDNEVVFNFGKYKGQRVQDVLASNPGYYNWMRDGDFPRSTIQVLEDFLPNKK